MQNQRGFIGLPILILILLGVAVLGGGAYFVVQQKTSTQTASKIPDAEIPTNIQAQSDVTTETVNNTQTIQTKPTKKQEDNVIASATLDSNPLKTSSTNPTISGTATGVSKIIVSLGDKGEIFWTSTPVSVINGRWSVVGSIPQSALSGGTPQFSILVNASTNSQGTLPSLTTGTLVVTNLFILPKLGKLFVTPHGIPISKIPEGWKIEVREELLSPDKPEAGTGVSVSFTDTHSNYSRALRFNIIVDKTLDVQKVAANQKALLNSFPLGNTGKIDSVKDIKEYGLDIKEVRYQGLEGSVDEDVMIRARIFSIPFYTYEVSGISSKTKESTEDFDAWYKTVFDSIIFPSLFNEFPNGMPIASYTNIQSKLNEIQTMVDKERVVPKGTPPDFFYSAACPTFTADMAFGDTDYSTNGQVSLLQTLLFGKYNVIGNITGHFDDLTMVYTVRFQREMGLEGSGGVGEKTRAALAKCRFSP